MNGVLKTVQDDKCNSLSIQNYSLDLLQQKDYWSINDILPLILQRRHVNPFNAPEMEDRVVSHEAPNHDSVEELAKRLELLIAERKCKLEGVCEIRNELYMEAFNELIRQITIDCPERGLFLASIRDEIAYSLSAFEELYDNSIGFNSKRQLSGDEGVDELTKRKEDLQRSLNEFKNKKIALTKELENLQAKQAEVETEDIKEKEQEIDFLKAQNQNLESFLQHVKTIKDPLEIKNIFDKK